jgi:cytochrome P450
MTAEPVTTWRTYPFTRTSPTEPPPELAEVREAEPVAKVRLWDGSTAWLATRYEDVRRTLMDPTISSDTTRPGFPQASATAVEFRRGQRVFVRMDAPKHDQHRLMLTADFTVKHVREYRPYLDDMIDELFDAMETKQAAGGTVDMVEDFALIVPSRVITRILDLPSEDSVFFLDRVKTSMSLDSTPQEAAQSGADTLAYFKRTIDERSTGDGQDLISRLVRDRVNTGQLTSEELQHILHLVLVGGFDTTANMIALGTLVFLQHPDQIALLHERRDLVPNAVEELLRYLSVAHHVAYRQAKEDTRIGDQPVASGESVIAPLIAANHDPEAFPHPERFDITRDARGHVAFGYGIHQCLGQGLARVELQAVFAKLFERFPGLALAAPMDTLRFRNSIIYGVEALPVTL